MGESAKGLRLPWGSLLTVGALSLALIPLYRGNLDGRSPLPWEPVWAGIAIGAAVFLLERRVLNYFWGFVAALLMAVHPQTDSLLQPAGPGLLAEAMLAALAAFTLLAWKLVFLNTWAWRTWLVYLALLTAGIELAWARQPRAGLLAALTVGLGLLLAGFLGMRLRWRKRRPVKVPSWLNLITAVVIALAAPGIGMILCAWLEPPTPSRHDLLAPFWTAVTPPEKQPLAGFVPAQMERWCWPTPWAAFPIVTLALWRTASRGWHDWRQGHAPVSWFLTLWAALLLQAAALLPMAHAVSLLSLVMLVVILAGYLAGDLVRAVIERLILKPPSERDEPRGRE